MHTTIKPAILTMLILSTMRGFSQNTGTDNTDIGLVSNMKVGNLHSTYLSVNNQVAVGIKFRRTWNPFFGFSITPMMRMGTFISESRPSEGIIDYTQVSCLFEADIHLAYDIWLMGGYRVDILGSMQSPSVYGQDIRFMHGFNVAFARYFSLNRKIALAPTIGISSSYSFKSFPAIQPVYFIAGFELLWRVK